MSVEFRAKLANMTPEAIYDFAEATAQKHDLTAAGSFSADQIDEIFNLHTAYQAVGDLEAAANVFENLRAIVDRFRESATSDADVDKGLEFLADWNFIAMNFQEESKTEFLCMPYYEEMFDAFEAAPPKLRPKEIKIYLQLIHHYKFWIAGGGDPEELPEEEYDFFQDLVENYVGKVGEIIADLRTNGEWETVVDLQRALYRFFRHGRKANDTIKALKALIGDLPKAPDYHPAETGDLNMKLGDIFREHGKWQTARKYYVIARDILHQQGEEYEVFAAQADGWIDECDKMLA